MGNTDDQKEQKPKRKRGFLGYLMIFFLALVFLTLLASGLVYWKRKAVTAKFLDFYSVKLADALTSRKYYQVGAEENQGQETQAEYLAKKREHALEKFRDLLKAYEASGPESDWYASLSQLDNAVKDIFADRKVYASEYQSFLDLVAGVTDKHRDEMVRKSSQESSSESASEKQD